MKILGQKFRFLLKKQVLWRSYFKNMNFLTTKNTSLKLHGPPKFQFTKYYLMNFFLAFLALLTFFIFQIWLLPKLIKRLIFQWIGNTMLYMYIKILAPLSLFSMRKFCFYCNDQTNHLFHVLIPGCLCRGIPLANCIMTGLQKYYVAM